MKILILIIILICFNKFLFANNLFYTTFYNIEFTSKNIDDDKIKEINKVKIDSLITILEKTLTKQYYNEVHDYLSEDLINTFIKNIIINDEKIINDKYISKIKINFDQKKIINFFREKNIPYIEYYPEHFLLIIYEKDNLNDNLLTKNNNYYKYFNNNFKNNKFFKIPKLDINDRFILKEEHIKNRNFIKINNFSKKYNSEEIIIVTAEKNKSKVSYNLILYSGDEVLEKKIKYEKNEFNEFFKILETETFDMWKHINQIQNNSIYSTNCKISYYNLFELKEIRKNLNNISIIRDLNIRSLSFKNINYDINYYGNSKILFKIFNLNNLVISDIGTSCKIRLK